MVGYRGGSSSEAYQMITANKWQVPGSSGGGGGWVVKGDSERGAGPRPGPPPRPEPGRVTRGASKANVSGGYLSAPPPPGTLTSRNKTPNVKKEKKTSRQVPLENSWGKFEKARRAKENGVRKV